MTRAARLLLTLIITQTLALALALALTPTPTPTLTLTHTLTLTLSSPRRPSRFLRELPAEMLSSEMAYDEPRA